MGGTVVIGKNTWIGIGAVVSNNITILEGCIVGAGAAVVKILFIAEHIKAFPHARMLKLNINCSKNKRKIKCQFKLMKNQFLK